MHLVHFLKYVPTAPQMVEFKSLDSKALLHIAEDNSGSATDNASPDSDKFSYMLYIFASTFVALTLSNLDVYLF